MRTVLVAIAIAIALPTSASGYGRLLGVDAMLLGYVIFVLVGVFGLPALFLMQIGLKRLVHGICELYPRLGLTRYHRWRKWMERGLDDEFLTGLAGSATGHADLREHPCLRSHPANYGLIKHIPAIGRGVYLLAELVATHGRDFKTIRKAMTARCVWMLSRDISDRRKIVTVSECRLGERCSYCDHIASVAHWYGKDAVNTRRVTRQDIAMWNLPDLQIDFG